MLIHVHQSKGARLWTGNEIKTLEVKNFGCIKDLKIKLTPLHAVIGPNGSGKSTLLRAARTGMQLLGGSFNDIYHPFNPGIGNNSKISIQTLLNPNIELEYVIEMENPNRLNESFKGIKGKNYGPFNSDLSRRDLFGTKTFLWMPAVLQRLGFDRFVEIPVPRMIRLEPDSLRQPGGLIPSSDPVNLQEKGNGLASILDSLIKRNNDGYQQVRKKIRDLFPTVADINLENLSGNMIQIGIKLKNGALVKSEFISEGMLYYLAYASLQYLEPSSIILIEEPENGLHPSRIKEIMTIIRELSKTTQILISTHSPLVINEMQPEEVTILWRDDDKGTQRCAHD